jgi:N-acetylglucosaminyldiphosphoundecaprenol N-acetyl-beta-D-mannosaminyltransferase
MTRCKDKPEKVEVLGIHIDSLTLEQLLLEVEAFIREKDQKIVLYVNVHCMDVAYRDPEYKRLLQQADLVYCDGFGVVLGARILGRRLSRRMTGADWIYNLAAVSAEKGYRLFFLGGEKGVAEKAALELERKYPGLEIAGCHHGYLQLDRDGPELVEMINQSRTDILLVGFGTPLQEKLIFQHRTNLKVPVIWAVGALFDFASGKTPRAPQWMLNHGLEWLYRFLIEPGRLWRRYLLGNTKFIFRVLMHRMFGPIRR